MMKMTMIWNNKAGASRPRPHFFTGFFWWHERRPFSISYGDHDDDDEDHADDDDDDGDDDDGDDDDDTQFLECISVVSQSTDTIQPNNVI